jgi:uncharacterized RDD family membrane protein YckC
MTEENLELHGGFDIETPEHVAFRMERAGLGTRVFAALLDGLFVGFVYLVFILAFFFLAGSVGGIEMFEDGTTETIVLVLWAIFVLLSLFLFWGYYIGFEAAWNGQTPGKRLLGIRVVADGGLPATFGKIVIRNLVRLVDMQIGYAVGLVTIFLTKDEKRLGDLAAGTVVIRERRRRTAPAMRLGAPTPAARRLDPELLELTRRYWERSDTIEPATRWKLARDLSDRITSALGRPPSRLGRDDEMPPEQHENEFRELTEELFEIKEDGGFREGPSGTAGPRTRRDAGRSS